jgi:hypothetical protein
MGGLMIKEMDKELISSVEKRCVDVSNDLALTADIQFLAQLAKAFYDIAYRYAGRDMSDAYSQAPSPSLIKKGITRTLTNEVLEHIGKQ